MAVVQAVDEVHVSRTAASGADGQRPRQVGFGAGGEGRDLLVPHPDPFKPLALSEGLREPVEGITDHAVHAPDPGTHEHLHHRIRDARHEVEVSTDPARRKRRQPPQPACAMGVTRR
jgi:hypothetical protein